MIVGNRIFRRGFTLLEMSIVLIIASVVSAGVMVVMTNSLSVRQVSETNAKLDTIQKALFAFRVANDRLPCPADITYAITNASFGAEVATPGSCPAATFLDATGTSHDARGGMVPTQTLRLPDDYAFDAWGRRILYAVAKDITQTGAFNTFLGNDSTTRIAIKNSSALNATTQAAYALVSFGANGHGAYPRSGGATRINASSTNSDEQINCHCTSGAAANPFLPTFVQKDITLNSASRYDTFDDIVVYATRADLVKYSALYWIVINANTVVQCVPAALSCTSVGAVRTCNCNQ